ncbi:helix-turn-helix domain-containing protein [Nonomuraea sp. H19]|uniref:PucR family transcriptional regulator n=1 Tax=Nonomuraea sp. H19 TaxID=3452206 RepID=UPI003F8CDABC
MAIKSDSSERRRTSADIVTPLRTGIGRLSEEVVKEIQARIPEYARTGDELYAKALRMAVEQAIEGFLDSIENPAAPWDPDPFRMIGRSEAAEGRNLEPLQSAMRLSARVGWRRLTELARPLGLSPESLYDLGEAIFVYLDRLADAAAEGFEEARAHTAGEIERRRSRLLDLLLSQPPASAEAVADLAKAAGWRLPRTVACVALDDQPGPPPAAALPGGTHTPPPQPGSAHTPPTRPGSAHAPPAPPGSAHAPPAHSGHSPAQTPSGAGSTPANAGSRRDSGRADGRADGRRGRAEPRPYRAPALPPDVLVGLERPVPCLLVPDPNGPGQAQMLHQALRGRRAAIGPPVPLAAAATSLRWAQESLELSRRGVLPGGLLRCEDHLATLVVFKDEELVSTLTETRLAPLAHLRPTQQDRLAETLLAWLRYGRGAGEVAAKLHVHPQTVRYRLRQLEELYGDQLADPDIRFELEIALRARQAVIGAAGKR